MKANTFLAAGVSVAALLAATCAVSAPAPAAAPAAASPAPLTVSHGPALANVCIFGELQALTTSTPGQAIRTRMEQIVNQVRAEVGPQETALDTDGKALEAARPTLDAATFQKRYADLNLRAQTLRTLEQTRQAELQYTERHAYTRLSGLMTPVLGDAYQSKACSLLLDRQAVLLANPAMDLTPLVVTGLNAKVAPFSFDLEHVPPGQQGQGQ